MFGGWLSNKQDEFVDEGDEQKATGQQPTQADLLQQFITKQQEKDAELTKTLQGITEVLVRLQQPVKPAEPVEQQLTPEQLSAIMDDPSMLQTYIATLAKKEAALLMSAQEPVIRKVAQEEAGSLVRRETAQSMFFQQNPDLVQHADYVAFRLGKLTIPPTMTEVERQKFVADTVRRELNIKAPTPTPGQMTRTGGGAMVNNETFQFDSEDFFGSMEKMFAQKGAK